MDQLIESPAFEDVRQRTQQPEPEALAATRGSGFRRHSEPPGNRGSGWARSPGGRDDEGLLNCANSSIDGDNEKTAFEDDVEVLDGEWDGPVDGRPRSNFGILCGNSGGDWCDEEKNQCFIGTLLETPAHVICLQEASERLCTELKPGAA